MKEDIKITYAREKSQGAVLKVIGVGGGGGNAVNRMIEEGLQGVEFIAINTDVQDLANIKPSAITLQIGEKITRGLGVGSNSDLGMQAALENTDAIIEVLEGANMVFITAGMGGGTGTGASQVVANHAASMGILTVAVVTKPFEFEGDNRMNVAEAGIKNLSESTDAILVIPNQKLFEIEDANISYKDAYKKVDEILLKAVRGISDIISNAGYQNVDFADVKAAMSEKGRTLMGTGEARGENRADEAVRKALTSPLLDNISIQGATGILYNITASSDLSLKEIGVIAEVIKINAAPEAKIKFGIVDDDSMGDVLRVTVIATGVRENDKRMDARPAHKMGTPLSAMPKPRGVNTGTVKPASLVTPENPVLVPERSTKAQPSQAASNRQEKAAQESNMGYYLGKPAQAPTSPANLTGYVNESNLPSMMQDPESVDDFLDVPSFQRPKITEKREWR
jgi:cell division protein FtsZ